MNQAVIHIMDCEALQSSEGIRQKKAGSSYLEYPRHLIRSLLSCKGEVVPDRPTLHEDDRVVAVLALNRGRRSCDKKCLRSTGYFFKHRSGNMMAFIHDDLPIIFDQGIHPVFVDQAVQDGNVDQPGLQLFTGSYLSNGLRRRFEEYIQTLSPLIHELARVNKHKSVCFSLSNQPGGDNGLAKCSRSCEHTCFVSQKSLRSLPLRLTQLSLKLHFHPLASGSFIVYECLNSQCLQGFHQFPQATWQEVESLVEMKLPKHYEAAVQMLAKLKKLSEFQELRADYRQRLDNLCERYRNRPGFKSRVQQAKLLE